ncbi:hypothetical protein WDU94_015286 [Cyamophila willieti]
MKIKGMDRKTPTKRRRKQAKDENYWDCSVCTYRNVAEAFKCSMCDVRKGTSTRKPRITPDLVAQVTQQYPVPVTSKVGPKKEGGKDKSENRKFKKHGRRKWNPPKLKHVDRASAQTLEITVNNLTVKVTEFKPKVKKNLLDSDLSSVESESSLNTITTD